MFCAWYRFYFQVRQARRRCTRLLTGALVNQLILRLIKCPEYPQPPKRGTPATVQFTRMTLIRPPCSSHRLAAGHSDTHTSESYNRSYQVCTSCVNHCVSWIFHIRLSRKKLQEILLHTISTAFSSSATHNTCQPMFWSPHKSR
jgi:hypothetical protein